MTATLAYVLRYLRYRLKAQNAHGIHSPFVYHFITQVLYNHTNYYVFRPLSVLRKHLALDHSTLEVIDHGAGSRSLGKSGQRKISAIVKTSVKAGKYAELLFRMVQEYRLKTIVELGTSLGITTLYLSNAAPDGQVYTIEGDPATAAFAKSQFEKFKRQNITAETGLFKEVLPGLLSGIDSIDLAFIDGHHTGKATLENFHTLLTKASEKAVFVIDDIHWSKDMEDAWEEIKSHEKSQLTIDLFEMGLIFLEPRNQREHFIIRY